MRNAILTAVVVVLSVMPQAALAQAPILIDFDDVTAPCDLGAAQPLRDEYAALSVVFLGTPDGGAAVLHECSGDGIPGYSPPNFAVIDPSAQLASGAAPESLVVGFTGDAPRHVRVEVGGPPGTTVILSCGICPWSIPECDRNVEAVMGSGMRTLEVWTESSFPLGCEVRPGHGQTGTWIVDDLELRFQVPIEPIPVLSGHGVGLLVALMAALGVLMARRVSGR